MEIERNLKLNVTARKVVTQNVDGVDQRNVEKEYDVGEQPTVDKRYKDSTLKDALIKWT